MNNNFNGITIHGIKFKQAAIVVSVTEECQEKVITSGDLPHRDFGNAFLKIRDIIAKRQPESLVADTLQITSVDYFEKDGGCFFKVGAQFSLMRLDSVAKFKTKLQEGTPEFWNYKDSKGNLVNKPENNPLVLTCEEARAFEALFYEGYQFIYEGKCKEDDQGDLFETQDVKSFKQLAIAADETGEEKQLTKI